MKKENAETVKELDCSKHALKDVTNEVKVIIKHWVKAEKEAKSLEKAYNSVASDCAILEESIENTREVVQFKWNYLQLRMLQLSVLILRK